MTPLQIINRVLAAALATALAPWLTRIGISLTVGEYATLAAGIGAAITTAYHWAEVHYGQPNAPTPKLSGTDLAAIVRVVLGELQKSAPAGASANPTPAPSAPTA